MRYFTPELYVRFNSADDEVADQANQSWEEALAEYEKHVATIRDQMPDQVRKLSELNLHDAELLACDEAVEPNFSPPSHPLGPHPLSPAMAIVSVKHGDQIASLIYLLQDRIQVHPALENWSFSKLRTHWLYDELDVVPGKREVYIHRVLLSDGRVLEIPFYSVFIHGLSLSAPSDGVKVRQSA